MWFFGESELIEGLLVRPGRDGNRIFFLFLADYQRGGLDSCVELAVFAREFRDGVLVHTPRRRHAAGSMSKLY